MICEKNLSYVEGWYFGQNPELKQKIIENAHRPIFQQSKQYFLTN